MHLLLWPKILHSAVGPESRDSNCRWETFRTDTASDWGWHAADGFITHGDAKLMVSQPWAADRSATDLKRAAFHSKFYSVHEHLNYTCLNNAKLTLYRHIHLYHCRVFIHCIKLCCFIWDDYKCRYSAMLIPDVSWSLFLWCVLVWYFADKIK